MLNEVRNLQEVTCLAVDRTNELLNECWSVILLSLIVSEVCPSWIYCQLLVLTTTVNSAEVLVNNVLTLLRVRLNDECLHLLYSEIQRNNLCDTEECRLEDGVGTVTETNLLSNLSCVDIVNFGDTVIQTVALEKIKGVKMVPDRVRIGLYPDIMTEESIDVPVGSINMPEGKVLRTFPSRVKVNFIVGASMFRNITADQFQVVVDYNELMEHPSDKCNIYLKASPHSVRSAKLSISQVDYLIEQQ